MDGASDEDLMAAVAAGERHALGVLYDRHAERVHSVAWRYLGNPADAADATQAVFLGLIDGARHFRPEARFTTWLYRVTVNRCLTLRTTAYARRRTTLDDAQMAQLPDLAGSIENRADERELRDRVRAALDRLPERQRMAIVLSRYEGLSYEEIAQALECSIPSVESLIFRAREALRSLLAP